MAAKQVFGAEQKQYKKQLIALKTRNESENSSSHVMQQEDLQDWLDNLQFRLNEACTLSTTTTTTASSSGTVDSAAASTASAAGHRDQKIRRRPSLSHLSLSDAHKDS